MKKITITGGAGYVGAVLAPFLLRQGYQVTVIDLMLYGDEVFPKETLGHPDFQLIKGDIRSLPLVKAAFEKSSAVIHLACLSNDPSFDLDPALGKSINLDAFEPMVQIAVEAGVERFIYASSSSVYGVKSEKFVSEDLEKNPLTDYSKYKLECEGILNRYQSKTFTPVTLRPATVCGYSPRQRLDVIVNILTNLAFHKREMTVFGGEQLRPNIHILDMVRAYRLLLDVPKEIISGKIYNVGAGNHSVNQIAEKVRTIVGEDVTIVKRDSNDQRSYHISSEKIKKELGFTPIYSVEEGIEELKRAFEKELLPNSLEDKKYFNIETMKGVTTL